MFCKECGAKHPGFINYCPNDGQELLATVPSGVNHRTVGYCAGCGNGVEASAQYCQHCGESHSTLKIGTVKKVQQGKVPVKNFDQTKFIEEAFSSKTMRGILIATALSILLAFAAAFLLKSQVENAIATLSDGEISAADISSIENYFAKEIEYETGLSLDLPNIYNIFTYISLIHGVDFELTGDLSNSEDDDYVEGGFDVTAQNVTSPLLLIVLVVLILSGIGLGVVVKKNQVSLWQSILGFSVFYGIFVTISSFIASFTYKNSLEVLYTSVNIKVKGNFPLIESFFSGMMLALVIAGLTALITVYGKQTLEYLQTKASYIQYASYSAFLVIIGVILTISISIGFLLGAPGTEDIFEESNYMGLAIIGAFGMWVWNFAHLLPISVSYQEFGDTETHKLHLFNSFSDDRGEIFNSFFYTDTMPLWISLSFLIPALLLAGAGYLLYRIHDLNIWELAKFSLMYGLFMVIIKAFTTLKVTASNSLFGESNDYSAFVHADFIVVFLISSLFALAFISAGGFVKRYVSKA